MTKVTNVLLVGVGGQGTILAGKIIAALAQESGLDVKMSEIHGMSQRGGSVVTQVRFGAQVFAPTIDPGEADYVLAFEKLEALRAVSYLRQGGVAVVNDQEINPLPVLTGAVAYPEDTLGQLRGKASRVVVVPALKIAAEVGSIKTANVVLLGALARGLSFERQAWEQAISQQVPPKYREMNLLAFARGYELAGN